MKHKKNNNLLNKQKLAFAVKGNYIFWLAVSAFGVISIFFTIQTATSGAHLAQLEKEEANSRRENQALSAELVKLSSLTSIKEEAEQLGFGKPAKVIYIKAEETVAQLP